MQSVSNDSICKITQVPSVREKSKIHLANNISQSQESNDSRLLDPRRPQHLLETIDELNIIHSANALIPIQSDDFVIVSHHDTVNENFSQITVAAGPSLIQPRLSKRKPSMGEIVTCQSEGSSNFGQPQFQNDNTSKITARKLSRSTNINDIHMEMTSGANSCEAVMASSVYYLNNNGMQEHNSASSSNQIGTFQFGLGSSNVQMVPQLQLQTPFSDMPESQQNKVYNPHTSNEEQLLQQCHSVSHASVLQHDPVQLENTYQPYEPHINEQNSNTPATATAPATAPTTFPAPASVLVSDPVAATEAPTAVSTLRSGPGSFNNPNVGGSGTITSSSLPKVFYFRNIHEILRFVKDGHYFDKPRFWLLKKPLPRPDPDQPVEYGFQIIRLSNKDCPELQYMDEEHYIEFEGHFQEEILKRSGVIADRIFGPIIFSDPNSSSAIKYIFIDRKKNVIECHNIPNPGHGPCRLTITAEGNSSNNSVISRADVIPSVPPSNINFNPTSASASAHYGGNSFVTFEGASGTERLYSDQNIVSHSQEHSSQNGITSPETLVSGSTIGSITDPSRSAIGFTHIPHPQLYRNEISDNSVRNTHVQPQIAGQTFLDQGTPLTSNITLTASTTSTVIVDTPIEQRTMSTEHTSMPEYNPQAHNSSVSELQFTQGDYVLVNNVDVVNGVNVVDMRVINYNGNVVRKPALPLFVFANAPLSPLDPLPTIYNYMETGQLMKWTDKDGDQGITNWESHYSKFAVLPTNSTASHATTPASTLAGSSATPVVISQPSTSPMPFVAGSSTAPVATQQLSTASMPCVVGSSATPVVTSQPSATKLMKQISPPKVTSSPVEKETTYCRKPPSSETGSSGPVIEAAEVKASNKINKGYVVVRPTSKEDEPSKRRKSSVMGLDDRGEYCYGYDSEAQRRSVNAGLELVRLSNREHVEISETFYRCDMAYEERIRKLKEEEDSEETFYQKCVEDKKKGLMGEGVVNHKGKKLSQVETSQMISNGPESKLPKLPQEVKKGKSGCQKDSLQRSLGNSSSAPNQTFTSTISSVANKNDDCIAPCQTLNDFEVLDVEMRGNESCDFIDASTIPIAEVLETFGTLGYPMAGENLDSLDEFAGEERYQYVQYIESPNSSLSSPNVSLISSPTKSDNEGDLTKVNDFEPRTESTGSSSSTLTQQPIIFEVEEWDDFNNIIVYK